MFELSYAGTMPDVFGRWRDYATIADRAIRRNAELRQDPAASFFFSGSDVNQYEPMVSDFGTRLSKKPFHVNGRPVGAVVQMSNLGSLEGSRAYAALNEGTSSSGGSSVPLDFWAEVIQQMKLVDELFTAARWITTATGRPLDLPLADDTQDTSAAFTVTENAAFVADPVNPVFAQLQFGSAPLWSTGRILLSWQLLEDSPAIYDYLVSTFAQRFSRGLGANFIATLLTGVDDYMAASANGIVPEDLLGLVESVDPAYAMQGGWLMSWGTWLAVRKLTTSNHYFVAENGTQDADGRLRLLNRPVYICNSLDSIGAGKRPILYGQLRRFVVRSVFAEQTVNKYTEVFQPTAQIGFEGVWRVNAALAKASDTDAPIKALRLPLS
jgi:HK97 family phage major capsid protein